MLNPLLKILSQPGPTLQAGFFIGMWGKELATEKKKKKKRHFSHGRTRKNTEIRAGSVSDGWRMPLPVIPA
jgi:hypothetical protein